MESYYTHLGASNYLVTLKVYRDCGPANTLGTGFDEQVYIGMWDGIGQIGDNDVLTIPLTQSNVSNVPVALGNPCGTPPPDLCIEQAIYSTTVSCRHELRVLGFGCVTVLSKPIHQQPPKFWRN